MSNEQTDEFASADVAILGSLLTAGAMGTDSAERLLTSADAAGITPEWFREAKHHNMYAAINAAWRRFHALDVFQIKDCYDALARGDEGFGPSKYRGEVTPFAPIYEELIDQTATTAHFEYYLYKFKRKHAYGVVHKRLATALSELTPDNVDIETESLARSLIDMSDQLVKGDANQGKKLSAFMADSVAKKRKLHEERFIKHNWEYMDGEPWPWHCMNKIFAGLKTGLHVIGALTSDGKSTMASNLSVFWNERGIRHGYFSIDMAAEQMADRYPCVAGRVSLAKLNFGGSAEDLRKFESGFAVQSELDNVTLSEEDDVGRIALQVARGVRSEGWRAIIIDYIQLLTENEKGQMPEYTRVQHVVKAAKRIAKKHKIPVICLAQLSRAFEKELRDQMSKPGTDAIGDSAEIARAAASITVLYKDADMVKYWEENPPTQLAFGDKDDMAIRCKVVSVAHEDEDMKKQRRQGQLSLAKTLRPMWVDVIKNQQGGKARVPFVMYPNYFLFRPGNEDGLDKEVMIGGKSKRLPVGKFEAICDDWTYTAEDWWLEMTGAMPQRGCRLMGETYAQMRERFAREREKHPEVKHFVREYDQRGEVTGWHWQEAKQ